MRATTLKHYVACTLSYFNDRPAYSAVGAVWFSFFWRDSKVGCFRLYLEDPRSKAKPKSMQKTAKNRTNEHTNPLKKKLTFKIGGQRLIYLNIKLYVKHKKTEDHQKLHKEKKIVGNCCCFSGFWFFFFCIMQFG
jgi:hypothetical protein